VEGWGDSSRDWPSTLSRGRDSPGAARARELERSARREPGSHWPLHGGSASPSWTCGHIAGWGEGNCDSRPWHVSRVS
jgi:hypothetical protein